MSNDQPSLTGRTALVTGAGQGIGRTIAHSLAEAGAVVVVNDLNAESARRTCAELDGKGRSAVAATADVGDDQAVAAMVASVNERLGPVDVLVNNAASPAQFRTLAESPLEERERELVTLLGTIHCTHHVCPGMIERRWGRIINISSAAGRYAQPTRAVYSAAKAGIDAFTKAMAKELGAFGITVNAVSPGATETPRFKARSEEVRSAHRAGIALDRFAEPEEIAHAVVFLAGPRAAYVSGAVLDIDGGFGGYPPVKT